MFTWLKLIFSSLPSMLGKLFSYLDNKQLLDAGGKKAELEGMKEDDKLSKDIADARADDSVRNATTDKYTRD